MKLEILWLSRKVTLGITPAQLETVREIPQSFFVDNNTIYILDTVKKRIAIYNNKGDYLNSIPLDFINYPKDLLIHNKNIYLLAETGDSAVVYTLDSQGAILSENVLPCTIKGYEAKSLAVTKSSNIAVTTDRYEEYELNNDGTATKTSDGRTSPYRDKSWKAELCSDNKIHLRSVDGTVDQTLDINALPAGAVIVGDDNSGNTYVMVGDMADTSKVIVESTIRKIDKNGLQVGVVRLPLEKCTNFPQKAIDVKNNGNVYFMTVYDNGIEIEKLNFDKTYKSTILDDQAKQKAKESKDVNNQPSANNDYTISALYLNSRSTTYSRAEATTYQFIWNYTSANNVNPDPSKITRPDWLTSYGSKVGIPYCWGGFDTKDRASTTSWISFTDAMNKGKFAGNVNTSTSGYQSGTAGVDCSGFVGSAVGYTTKPSTTTINNDTHSHTLSQRDYMDIYIKAGSHVLFYYCELNDGSGIVSYESTTTGDDKSKQTNRSYTWLSTNGYSLKSWW